MADWRTTRTTLSDINNIEYFTHDKRKDIFNYDVCFSHMNAFGNRCVKERANIWNIRNCNKPILSAAAAQWLIPPRTTIWRVSSTSVFLLAVWRPLLRPDKWWQHFRFEPFFQTVQILKRPATGNFFKRMTMMSMTIKNLYNTIIRNAVALSGENVSNNTAKAKKVSFQSLFKSCQGLTKPKEKTKLKRLTRVKLHVQCQHASYHFSSGVTKCPGSTACLVSSDYNAVQQ